MKIVVDDRVQTGLEVAFPWDGGQKKVLVRIV